MACDAVMRLAVFASHRFHVGLWTTSDPPVHECRRHSEVPKVTLGGPVNTDIFPEHVNIYQETKDMTAVCLRLEDLSF